MVVYVTIFLLEPGLAAPLSVALGFCANSWVVLPAGLIWLLLPLVEGDNAADPASAGAWNAMPVILLFVVPAACFLIGAGIVLRRGLKRLRRWQRSPFRVD